MTEFLLVPAARRSLLVPRLTALLVSLLVLTGAPAGAGAAAKPKAPKLTALRCVPVTAPACKRGTRVAVRELVLIRGARLLSKQRVTFAWSKGHTTGKTAKKKGITGYVVQVPKRTRIGSVRVTVKDRHGRRSNTLKLKIVAATPTPVAPPVTPGGPVDPALAGVSTGAGAVPAPFAGAGMWITNLTDADGGTADALINRARAGRISTIFLKSADGTSSQASQFSASLVSAIKAAGIRICGWQYVYGTSPESEAAVALEAINAGADCFVIDAEAEYAGRYSAAQRYLKALRAGAGADYPLGLTSYARPQTQPTVPLSVFLGPGGAQVNLPQVYWGELNTPVAALSKEAAAANRIYGRPIVPIGQTYGGATVDDVQSFRSIWHYYGAPDVSWFRWGGPAVTPPEVWTALGAPTPMLDPPADPGWRLFQQGDTGDGVTWIQRLLADFDPSVDIDGTFGAGTDAALRKFQVAKGLSSTGGTGPQTWPELLKLTPKAVDYVK